MSFSQNNSKFRDNVDHFHTIELKLKNTTCRYLDLCLDIDSEECWERNLRQRNYFFNFPIANFSFIYSNTQTALQLNYISLSLVWYSTTCVPIRISICGLLPTWSYFNQFSNEYSFLHPFYERNITFRIIIMSVRDWLLHHNDISTDATSGAGSTFPPGPSQFISGFQWCSHCSICELLITPFGIFKFLFCLIRQLCHIVSFLCFTFVNCRLNDGRTGTVKINTE